MQRRQAHWRNIHGEDTRRPRRQEERVEELDGRGIGRRQLRWAGGQSRFTGASHSPLSIWCTYCTNNKLKSIESYFACVNVYRLVQGNNFSLSLPLCSQICCSCPSSTHHIFPSGDSLLCRLRGSPMVTFLLTPQKMHHNYRKLLCIWGANAWLAF